ncbi:MAG: hypothetical protein Q9M17_07770 [Mariprofundus sp.]|nr:hypothetical protein [Mariprofundus sp.]
MRLGRIQLNQDLSHLSISNRATLIDLQVQSVQPLVQHAGLL